MADEAAFPGLGKILGGAISPVIDSIGKIVDNLNTSTEEKLEATRKLAELERQWQQAVLQADVDVVKAKAEVVKAEATSEGMLARNWRPILMLVFTYIILHNYVLATMFHLQVVPIPPDMWDLLRLGIGGYVIGRSAEKIVPGIVEAVKK